VLFAVDHNSPYYHEENKGSVFYAESWALVHYLEVTSRQNHQDRITAYARLLSQKQDPVTAATAAFGDLGTLQKELEAYIRADSFRYFRMASPPAPDVASFQTSVVSPAGADARRAEFLAYNGRIAEAHTLLDAILKQDPNNAAAYETLGYMAMQEHDMEGARKWLTKAVQLDSKSYLANYYYASMSLSADGLKNAPAIESSLQMAIKLNPAFAPSYDRLASLYNMQRDHLEEAHILELHAAEIDPSNVYYRLNMARLLVSLTRDDDALRVLESARPLARNASETAMVDQTIRQVQQTKNARAAQVAAMQEMQTTPAITETSSPAELAPAANVSLTKHPVAAANAPRHEVRGTLHAVRCGPPSLLELEVQGAAQPVALYANNYFKIEFSALNFNPAGEMHPCTDLEGKHARVLYAETADKTAAGQILSIQLTR
jgi:tetratricopeptide (TPR) repeat protein